MSVRQIIACVIFVIGFLLVVGAVGEAEFDYILASDFWIRSISGLVLIAASIPVSGELSGD